MRYQIDKVGDWPCNMDISGMKEGGADEVCDNRANTLSWDLERWCQRIESAEIDT